MPVYKPANPSFGLIKRMLGDPMSESTQKDYPELARAWASAQVRMPKETSNVNRVSANITNDSILGRYTPIIGEVDVNKQANEQDGSLRNTLVHEITHANQPSSFKSFAQRLTRPWNKRDEEIEAEDKASYKNNPIRERRHDTYLPPEMGDIKDPRIASYRTDPTLELRKKLLASKLGK